MMVKKQKKKQYAKVRTAGLAGLLVLAQCTTAVMPVMAAEDKNVQYQAQTTNNGSIKREDIAGLIPSSVADIFDAEFYMNKYPDVKAVFGYDPQALLMHYLQFGLKEGRTGSPILDITKYRSLYPDLETAFGDNWDLYVKHYFEFGIAEGRSNGIPEKAVIKKTVKTNSADTTVNNIIYDSDGDILVPWENIVGNSSNQVQDKYLTMESLRKLCGDTLVLLQDKEGNVTFVGGNFSSVKVTDPDSARDSIQCMMKLLDFPEDTKTLCLTHMNVASNGDYYYRFSAGEKDETAIYSDTDIVVGADQQGKVLCLSSSSGTRYYDEEVYEREIDWEEVHEWLAGNGYTLMSEEPVLKYDSNMNQYAWTEYYERDGIILEYSEPVASQQRAGYSEGNVHFYKEMPTEDSYSFDYFFENDIQTQDMTFTDYFGNQITLPVAKDENGYYILDKERKIIGVNAADSLFDNKPYYFSDPAQLESHFVSSIYTIQNSFDSYRKLGLFEDPIAFLIRIDKANTNDNAWCSYTYGAISLNINNHVGNASFDAVSHELGHGVLAHISGGLDYQNATGAINESYADILGNLLEMIAYEKGEVNLGAVDMSNWYIEEAQKAVDSNWGSTDGIIRNMSNPNEKGQPSLVGGKYYVIGTDMPDIYINDNGGVHTNNGILNNICYRMYKDAGISLNDLLVLWYDTLQLLTQDSDYKSIQGYMQYNLRRHGLEDKIEAVNQIFKDARVDAYENNTTWDAIAPADGTSKVIVNFKNLPQDVSVGAVWADNQYLTADTNGQYAIILDEGESVNKLTVVCRDEKVHEKYFAGNSDMGNYTVAEDDTDFTVDYYDILAGGMTNVARVKDNFEIPDDYKEQFVKLHFTLKDENTDKISQWSILLRKEAQEDVNVTVDVVTGASRNSDGEMPQSLTGVLRDDSKYDYVVSVIKEGNVWMKWAQVDTAQLEENDTVEIDLDNPDGWTVTYSQSDDSNTAANEQAATEDATAEQAATEDATAEQAVTEDATAEQTATEDATTEQVATEDATTEQVATEDTTDAQADESAEEEDTASLVSIEQEKSDAENFADSEETVNAQEEHSGTEVTAN